MSTEPTVFDLADQLADALWAIRQHRPDGTDDERRDDVQQIVADVVDHLDAKGLADAEYLLDALEYACLTAAGLLGWDEMTDDLIEQINGYLDDEPSG
jgi:hypothetical protein